jgi:hypothetical protein
MPPSEPAHSPIPSHMPAALSGLASVSASAAAAAEAALRHDLRAAIDADPFAALLHECGRLHVNNGGVATLAGLTMISSKSAYALTVAIEGDSALGKSLIAERAADLVGGEGVTEATVMSRAGLAAIGVPAVLVLDELCPSEELLAVLRRMITKKSAQINLGNSDGTGRQSKMAGPMAILNLHLPSYETPKKNDVQNRNRYLTATLDPSQEQARYRAEQVCLSFGSGGAPPMKRYRVFADEFHTFHKCLIKNLEVVNDHLLRVLPDIRPFPADGARLLTLVGNLTRSSGWR